MRDYLPDLAAQAEDLRERFSAARGRYEIAAPFSDEWHEAAALAKKLEVEFHGLQVLGALYNGNLTKGKK